jgi:hypothetical protein
MIKHLIVGLRRGLNLNRPGRPLFILSHSDSRFVQCLMGGFSQ